MRSKPKPRILVVLHQEHSTPGRIGNWLVEQGYDLDIRRPRYDDPLPATMDEHAGAVIFGGPMSANDADAYVRREIDWIGVPLKANKPFLGLCLGAQMLAKYLGARVYVHPEGRAEIGYYPLRPTELGRKVCGEAFPDLSITGTAKGSTCPPAQSFWPKATTFRFRPCALRQTPSACSSTLKSPTR